MFKQDVKRIGFACKYLYHNQNNKKRILEDYERPYNTRATTVAWLNRQTREDAEQRLWEIMEHNIASFAKLIKYVGSLPNELRMVRLGSDVLPVYTEPTWSYFWRKDDVRRYCEREFAKVGEIARGLDVRLSMHPGQFTVLASDNDDIVRRSIEEFEYHVDCIRWMGYGVHFQDFKCNVHISGKRGPAGIKAVLPRLSPEARNTITIENDENSWGLDSSLELVDDVALVLDIHHHLIHTGGEYIEHNDDLVRRVIDSWRGVRPVIHFSQSREELLHSCDPTLRPDYQVLLREGYKKQKLRAHSDYCWNHALNEWCLEFWEDFDIMCEMKQKNLASINLYKYYTEKTNELSKQDVRTQFEQFATSS